MIDIVALATEFAIRCGVLSLLLLGSYLGASVAIRGNSRFGRIDDWDDELSRVFGLFGPSSVDSARSPPRTAICAKFCEVDEDASLERLREARRLYKNAATRFSNLRRPLGLLAFSLVFCLLGSALLVFPMLEQKAPIELRETVMWGSLSVMILVGFYYKHHVDCFSDLRALGKGAIGPG